MASPGRCSLGGYSDTSDVDRAVDALEHVAGGSVRYAYTRRPDGEWVADR